MLRTGLASAIALSNPDPMSHLFEDSNASAFMAGISEVCEKHQYGLTVLPPVPDDSRLTAIDKVAVDGFILYAIPDHSPIVKRILGRQLSTVTVDMGKLPAIAAVGIDDGGGNCGWRFTVHHGIPRVFNRVNRAGISGRTANRK